MKTDKEIKVADLKDILKYYFKLTPAEFRGGKSELLIFLRRKSLLMQQTLLMMGGTTYKLQDEMYMV